MSLYFKSNAPDIVKDEQSYIQYIELIIYRLIMMLLFYSFRHRFTTFSSMICAKITIRQYILIHFRCLIYG